MPIVGLTGSLKTGKSTVASMFRSLGATVIDADKISHTLIEKSGACYQRVVRKFGRQVLTKGRIDRKKLGKVVFSDRRKLKALTAIIHPEVKREIQRRISAINPKRVVILEVPLLFEAKFDTLCDVTIVVAASLKKQLARAQNQLGMSKDEAMQRIQEQMPLKKKVRLADLIIDNDKTKPRTNKQVKEIWQKQLQKIRK